MTGWTKLLAKKSGTELALHTPWEKSCFALCKQLLVCQDSFSWKDRPFFPVFMTNKSCTGPKSAWNSSLEINKEIRTIKNYFFKKWNFKQVLQTRKGNHGSTMLYITQNNYCMFKVSNREVGRERKKIYIYKIYILFKPVSDKKYQ